jgi:hypothetical protein
MNVQPRLAFGSRQTTWLLTVIQVLRLIKLPRLIKLLRLIKLPTLIKRLAPTPPLARRGTCCSPAAAQASAFRRCSSF